MENKNYPDNFVKAICEENEKLKSDNAYLQQNYLESKDNEKALIVRIERLKAEALKLVRYQADMRGHLTSVEMQSSKLQARCEILTQALSGIIEIGKRDMSNPKYDSYFEAAKETLASKGAINENL